MTIELAISIPLGDVDMCRSILESVQPDNLLAPKGITIDMECRNSDLNIIVRGEKIGILTFRNTVDDLLMHINTVAKTLSIFLESK